MQRPGIYHLGRVIKMGRLDEGLFVEALSNSISFERGNMAWMIIDVRQDSTPLGSFVFGRLCKYKPEGEISVVDADSKKEKLQSEPNLVIAASPFVYIPEHSGIAFLHVPGQIEDKTFIRCFSRIVREYHQRFFVDCDVEMISDLQSFTKKLTSLQGIYRMSATVVPPNPLFGPLWKSLKDHIAKRKSGKMIIQEQGKGNEPLNTEIVYLVRQISQHSKDQPFAPEKVPDIGDAAVLMAIDGYGKGSVHGRKQDRVIVIKTTDVTYAFQFDKDPGAVELHKIAWEHFQSIKSNRHLDH